MKVSRLSALGLASIWFAACATAENSASPGNSEGGSSGTTSGGAHTGGSSNGAFGGSTGVPGGAGRPGSSGSGTGGTSGSISGAGGLASGGATGGGAGTGVCAENPTVALEYLDQSNNPKQITGQYELINSTATPILLQDLKIRYFFTNEETSGWKMATYSPKLDGGTGGYRAVTGTTFTVVPLATPLDGADSYAEVAFPAGLSLEQGATLTVNWDMQPNDYNPPDQVQSNDYSFNAADATFTAWTHIAVYDDDTLVYGCLPKSTDEGAAGAGGDIGAGGAGGGAGAGGGGGTGAGGSGGAGTGGGAGAGTGGTAGSAGSSGSAGTGTGGSAGNAGSAGSL
jgi:Cellulose binding domain